MLVVSVATYSTHSRAHYDDLDQLLASAAQHVSAEEVGSLPADQLAQVLEVPAASGLVTRVYDPSGLLLTASPASSPAPALEPGPVMARPSVPASDPLAGFAPPFIHISAGAGRFTVARGGDGARWRVYVLPLSSGRYLELAASLASGDASVARLRLLLAVSGGAGALVAFLVAWLLAGRALRPVRTITATAHAIARSRSFNQRLPAVASHDELGELARTFNEMLGSLEAAYLAQQRFVADASHELRAPLTAIQANLELLERHQGMSVAHRSEAVAEASREAERLSRLVADLLALARADAGVPIRRGPVELDRLALESVQETRRIAEGRRIEVDKLEPVVVVGDGDRLKQLLLILLDNAVKYSPGGGKVGLQLRRNGSGAELRVRDNGVGIAQEDLSRVFERFYRADPARSRDPGGTGLGLPIARWIVEQHGGKIWIESKPGEGTEVFVRIPARAASP